MSINTSSHIEISSAQRILCSIKNVRFISISIDEDETKWKAKMEKDKPDWPHYLICKENATAFADIYGVTSIPRFMIFDKEGKMVMDNAPRPSEVKIDSILNGLK